MATGWAGDSAVQDQIDATIKDANTTVFVRRLHFFTCDLLFG